MEHKIAALDIGTNSVMMLIASCDSYGRFEIINELGAITKLGQGLSDTRKLSEDAIKRTTDVCMELVNVAKNEGVSKIITTTTSATRDALNKTELLATCHSNCNIFPQILTGKEEADFTYKGATFDVTDNEKPLIVIDVGGGSTEIAFGTKEIMVGAHSVDIGCVRLTELFDSKYTIFPKIRNPMRTYIKKESQQAIDDLKTWLDNREPEVICSGGTATTYAGIILKQNHYDRHQIDKTTSTRTKAVSTAKHIGRMRISARRKVPGMDPRRAEVFPTGLYILTSILALIGQENFCVTTNGLRMGVLKYYYEKNPQFCK